MQNKQSKLVMADKVLALACLHFTTVSLVHAEIIWLPVRFTCHCAGLIGHITYVMYTGASNNTKHGPN